MAAAVSRSLGDLLLQVAFGSDDVAREAWASVAPTLDIDHLPFELHGLFPLMAQTLRRLGLQPAELPRFDGVRKRLWTLNSVRLRALQDAVGVLRSNRLQPRVTGAMAVLLYRDDLGLRPLTEVDLAFEPDQGVQAAGFLAAAGWVVTARRRDGFLMDNVATVIEKAGQTLTLRWAHRSSSMSRSGDMPGASRHVAQARASAGAEVALDSPADVLAFTVVDGLSLPGYFPVRRHADALLLGGLRDPAVDWTVFVERVGQKNAQPEVAMELRRLVGLSGAPPAWVMSDLAAARVPMRERLMPGRDRFPTVSASLRRGRKENATAALTGVHRELAEIWDLAGPRTVARAAVGKVARRVVQRTTHRRLAR
jgi:hypothetical protein